MRVTPRSGGPGTVVTFIADVQRSCDPVQQGRGRMGQVRDVVCSERQRTDVAAFRVLPAGGSDDTVAKNTTNRNDGSQLPDRIDTGLGGTADDGGQGGIGPTRLLLPSGLLLIVVGAGLGLRQAARSRR